MQNFIFLKNNSFIVFKNNLKTATIVKISTKLIINNIYRQYSEITQVE